MTDTALPRPELNTAAGRRSASRTVTVIDTSVLVADPAALTAFTDTDVVVPLTVLEELDKLRQRQDQVGANARDAVRHLEELRSATGSLLEPIRVADGATVRVEPNGLHLDELAAFHLPAARPQHRILAAALGQRRGTGRPVRIVSCDAAMRLKADTLGLETVDFHPADPFVLADNPGWVRVDLPHELASALRKAERGAKVPFPAGQLDGVEVNEFVVTSDGLMARRVRDGLMKVSSAGSGEQWGLRARNKEQQFALDLLTDRSVEVVALSGRAGTGKSILAIAAALEQVTARDAHYDRVMVLRPMYALGKQDLGFLPGEVADKVAPWFDAVVDAMVALSRDRMSFTEASDALAQLTAAGKLTMEPVTFLRGRSLRSSILVLDEIQNLEAAETKTILTRLGEGSKIVLCGDPDQCDNPFTSPTSNGLAATVAAFRGHDVFGHVRLTACERSRVADLAADLL